jgi:hypothetical protein
MFGQFLPNTNETLQCDTVLCSESAGAKSTELNKNFLNLALYKKKILRYLKLTVQHEVLNVDEIKN